MYIVIATHDTGHGQVSTPIWVSRDNSLIALCGAIRSARSVTNVPHVYGYEFLNNDAMVCVYSVLQSSTLTVCKKEAMNAIVFVRRYVKIFGQEPRWEEEWFDKKIERIYEEEHLKFG